MRYVIVSIRDRAADIFGQPFFCAALGQGIRSFSDEVNKGDVNSALCNHPEDFDLYHLGFYDDADGSFEVFPPRMIAVGKDTKVVRQ